MMHLQKLFPILLAVAVLSGVASAQRERLTNLQIVEMTKVGLETSIILKKIDESDAVFDVSTDALIELRKQGVDNSVIVRMMEKKNQDVPVTETKSAVPEYSENVPPNPAEKVSSTFNAADALRSAKTVAIAKSSINPSRQSLEKALMKRAEWNAYKLTLIRYKEEADLFIEIGRVPLSWITHRYVFRIYDRRTGAIITAGETTSWGSLAENMAREITQKLAKVEAK